MGIDRSMIVTGTHTTEKRERARAMRQRMTPAEEALWQRLRAGHLEGLHFRRQQIIDGFIADFYCHAAGLVIEVDGGVHESQADYDAQRDRAIGQRGLRTLRLTNDDVLGRIDEVLKAILNACREA